MTIGTFVVLMSNLIYIGLLPMIFFRRDGRLNLMWWLMASPFFLSAGYIIIQYLGIAGAAYSQDAGPYIEAAAAFLGAASIALISFTLGTHRRRLSLWHQKDDAPEEIVTYGAYRYVRHPFYSSFILTLCAVALVNATAWALVTSAIGVLMLNYTAAREEKRLQGSQFGGQYKKYIQDSGRFVPRMGRTTS
jgi:protein-S-isoprenylcysteine O-methyltransferase Ste14